MERQAVLADVDAVDEAGATMYQPIAPCNAPSAKMPARLAASCARDASAPQEEEERQQEDDADQRDRGSDGSIPTSR